MFFHYLCGKIAALEENLAVVDCGGVGFECAVSSYTLAQLRMGEVQKLYTVCSVREDAFEIFGFATREEKRCFELLTSVGGVGPKVALNILSAGRPRASTGRGHRRREGPHRGPGCRQKLAQRILLELKDKLDGGQDRDAPAASGTAAHGGGAGEAARRWRPWAIRRREIAVALKDMDAETLSVEEMVRQALRAMVVKL